jgi:3D (Asp-Asp-Asp) domain-containing protein
MNFGIAPLARQYAERKLNRAVIRMKSLWMTVVLGIREITHQLATAMYTVSREMSPRRAIAVSVLATLILAPTILYFVERNNRRAQERAYQALALSAASEVSYFESAMAELLAERSRLSEFLLDSGYSIRTGDEGMVKVVATGYSSSIFETDSTPFITASNTRTRTGILALSRDLLKRYNPGAPFDFGDRVHVPGLGEFIVEDSMNSRWNNRIDVWFPSRLQALRFGVREVYLRTIDEDLTVPDELSESDPETATTGM